MASAHPKYPKLPDAPESTSTSSNSTATSQPLHTLEWLYAEAYAAVEQGICFDEVGDAEGAKAMYLRGLELIDRAIQIPGAEKADKYQKLIKGREFVTQRLTDMNVTPPAYSPSPYPALPASSPFDAISGALHAMGDVRQAEELYSIADGVQIFFIERQEASVPTYPTSLRVFRFQIDEPPSASAKATAFEGPPAFLQVGDWVYPLLPGQSPALEADYGAYLFPNSSSEDADAVVGIILPADLSQPMKEQFENLMKELTSLHTESIAPRVLSVEEKERLSKKLATMISTGCQWLCKGIEVGANYTSKLVGQSGEQVRSRVKKCEKAVTVDPRIQTSFHYLRRGTKVAVKVSGYLVNKLSDATLLLAKRISASAERRIGQSSQKGAGVFHDVVTVGGASIGGAAAVYVTLENAARVLAKSIANETVLVVDHRFGEEAASVAKDVSYSAYNSVVAYQNVESLGVRAIAKRTAKHTGLQLLKDLSGSSKQPKLEAASSDSKQLAIEDKKKAKDEKKKK